MSHREGESSAGTFPEAVEPTALIALEAFCVICPLGNPAYCRRTGSYRVAVVAACLGPLEGVEEGNKAERTSLWNRNPELPYFRA